MITQKLSQLSQTQDSWHLEIPGVANVTESQTAREEIGEPRFKIENERFFKHDDEQEPNLLGLEEHQKCLQASSRRELPNLQ